MYRILILCCLILLTACQALTIDDENLARQAELEAFGTEAAALRDQMQQDRTAVASTVEVVGTQAADFISYNGFIAATLRAGIPATATPPSLIVNEQGPMPMSMFDLSSGEMRFVQIGTAGQINPDDRCFISHQAFFNVNTTNVIFMTALGLNIRAGTNVRVDWQYGGEIVYSNAWNAPQSVDGQCVALELRPSNAPFTPGNWTATMSVNGEPFDPAPFTITNG
jgi:hypothetical protein